MKTFLMIVGGFLVALALFVLVIVLWLRAKLRKFTQSFSDQLKNLASLGSVVPPARIELEPLAKSDLEHADQMAPLAASLHELGFVPIGGFDAQVAPPLHLLALTHPQECIYAVIYERAPPGVWMDLVTRYADGTSYTCTTAPSTSMKRQPGKELERLPENDPAALYRYFLAHRPTRPALPTPPEQFVSRFEGAYAEEMAWQFGRGGPSEEEIRGMMSPSDLAAPPEQVETMIRLVRQAWQSQASDYLAERLREAFLAQAEMPAARWEEIRDRLVFIHDQVDAETLLSNFPDLEEEDHEGLVAREGARAAFQQLNSQGSAAGRFEKIAVLTTPTAADVYLAPPEPAD